MILEYFVDKIYIHDEKLVVMTLWCSEDKTRKSRGICWKGVDGDPLLKKEAVEFDNFPFGSINYRLWVTKHQVQSLNQEYLSCDGTLEFKWTLLLGSKRIPVSLHSGEKLTGSLTAWVFS